MILVLDVENSVTQIDDDHNDGSPYHPNNHLVSVGLAPVDPASRTIGPIAYEFLYHRDFKGDRAAASARIQQALDGCTLLVGHYLKHDLQWILESGFRYDGPVYDTGIGEYVLARGIKWPFSLEATAERRGVSLKKSHLVKSYTDKGIWYDKIPMHLVEEYGRADVQATAELYLVQQDIYAEPRNVGLIPTRDMMNEFCVVLTEMERNGIAIDRDALNQIERDYKDEQCALQMKLREMLYQIMGDTPINLASSEQLSMVIYSRRVLDKKAWANTFNIGTNERGKPLKRPKLSDTQFNQAVRAGTEVIRKTKAEQCQDCTGTGQIRRTKKDGTPYANPQRCKTCEGGGLIYRPLAPVAGLRLTPETVADISASGFATDKDTLKLLKAKAAAKGNQLAVDFLGCVTRLAAVDTYLTSFVEGIKRGLRASRIHPKYNQTTTSTGRLSSSDPNFQNQPRGTTFPVRKAIVSRWPGGSILEGDYAQLEFRAAGQLSGCPVVIEDVKAGIDVHTQTATALTDAGQPTTRQEAKADTFKPLYGGVLGTPAQMAYYRFFLKKYHGVAKWHIELQEEAIKHKLVTLPTGRQYAFPDAQRMAWGGSSYATQIKNYPVQGFATADMVPIGILLLHKRMKVAKVKSLLILTVHDSIEIDVYPGEEVQMSNMLRQAMLDVVPEMKRRYGIDFIIPIDVELKIGPNWLNSKVVHSEKKLSAPLEKSPCNPHIGGINKEIA